MVALVAREHTNGGRFLMTLMAVFLTLTILASVDIIIDLSSGTTLGHVITEGAIILVSLISTTLVGRSLWTAWQEERLRVTMLETELAATTADAERWRNDARNLIDGLGKAIDRQFETWKLTAAEKEVALMLLQGKSHKEVALERSVSQATARQQAQSIYRKAKLGGRHDLAAFFLSDLVPRRKSKTLSR